MLKYSPASWVWPWHRGTPLTPLVLEPSTVNSTWIGLPEISKPVTTNSRSLDQSLASGQTAVSAGAGRLRVVLSWIKLLQVMESVRKSGNTSPRPPPGTNDRMSGLATWPLLTVPSPLKPQALREKPLLRLPPPLL